MGTNSQIWNDHLVLRRNESELTLRLDDQDIMPDCLNYIDVRAHWNENELFLGWRNRTEEREDAMTTQPAAVPDALFRFVEQTLEKTIEYASEEAFRSRVYSCLESMQDKIYETKGVNSFWDITYSGNKIEKRQPKRETDIHEARAAYACRSNEIVIH
jgi:hypothetical protein